MTMYLKSIAYAFIVSCFTIFLLNVGSYSDKHKKDNRPIPIQDQELLNRLSNHDQYPKDNVISVREMKRIKKIDIQSTGNKNENFIEDATPLSQFTELESLTLMGQRITILDLSKQKHLKEANIAYNSKITSITLPPNIKTLNISGNVRLKEIKLPKGMTTLKASGCPNINLIGLEETSIETLFMSNNKLEVLPALPKGTTHLKISLNNLAEVLEIPQSMNILDISDNKNLHTLGSMPDSLKNLHATSCRISSFPPFSPNSTIKVIDLQQNVIESLPSKLPNTLSSINVSFNFLDENVCKIIGQHPDIIINYQKQHIKNGEAIKDFECSK